MATDSFEIVTQRQALWRGLFLDLETWFLSGEAVFLYREWFLGHSLTTPVCYRVCLELAFTDRTNALIDALLFSQFTGAHVTGACLTSVRLSFLKRDVKRVDADEHLRGKGLDSSGCVFVLLFVDALKSIHTRLSLVELYFPYLPFCVPVETGDDLCRYVLLVVTSLTDLFLKLCCLIRLRHSEQSIDKKSSSRLSLKHNLDIRF